MAFSTQRLFFRVPFHDEEPQLPDRKRSDCQLKTYESCTDVRAWSMDRKCSAQYLLDVLHKSRWPRKRTRPTGGLTRDYLLYFSTEELADFVLCFMTELKKAKYQLATLQHAANQCQQKLVRHQQQQEQQQRSEEVFDEARMHEDLAPLKAIIDELKCKANRYDRVQRENQCLRRKVQSLCKERECNERRSSATTVPRDDCGDSAVMDCAKLQAELCLCRNHCEELKVQKRTLMEELQRAKIGHHRVKDLKNQLSQEQDEREALRQKVEDLQIKYDVQAMELQRKTNYIAMCNRKLEQNS